MRKRRRDIVGVGEEKGRRDKRKDIKEKKDFRIRRKEDLEYSLYFQSWDLFKSTVE